eukprot:TRINITY_DN32167_c0_g1_i1.p1 TRINITY_DN32167_c0_g1~~TRINITY_DN32167_c0_g1_i1.p1  ORF type:complete len:595 (+),score=178.54 TRINITY_DN32167_c0_g1_i1:63-1787(+)
MASGGRPAGGTRQILVSHDVLGRGGFGKVFLGLTEDGDLVAVKEILVSSAGLHEIQEARREYDVLQRLTHPNIVQVYEFIFDTKTEAARIVMEFVPGGSVARVISSLGRLPERAAANYTTEILAGLDYLHTVPPSGVLHRDIKPHNILLRTSGSDGAQVKLADFGLCAAIRDRSSRSQDHLVGTVPYMSPASIKESLYTQQSDVWAVGCTVLEMASGKLPWSECGFKDHVPFMFHIGSKGADGETPRVHGDASPLLRAFLKRCFSAERTGTTCADLRSDPFLMREGDRDAESSSGAMEEVSDLLRKEEGTTQQLGSNLKNPSQPHWAFETQLSQISCRWRTSFGPSTTASSGRCSTLSDNHSQAPHGAVFREDLSLTWDKFWMRISQLPKFSGVPFMAQYGHVLSLVRFLMCQEGLDDYHCEEVSYNDDFCPFSIYFTDVEGVMEDIAELNRRSMFAHGVNTQRAEAMVEERGRGAMLLRPSKREKGKLALTVRLERGRSLETRHFLIVRSQESQQVTLYGAPSCPCASSLRELIDKLVQTMGNDFRFGAGNRAEPEGQSSYAGYAGSAYARGY